MSESATRGNLVVNKALLGLCAAHGWPKMLRSVEWGQPQCGERQRTGEGGGQGLGRSHCGGPSAATEADVRSCDTAHRGRRGAAAVCPGRSARVPNAAAAARGRRWPALLLLVGAAARHWRPRLCRGQPNHPRPRPDPGWGRGPGAALTDEPGAVLCLAGNAAVAAVANDAAFRTWISNAATGKVYPPVCLLRRRSGLLFAVTPTGMQAGNKLAADD